MAAPKKMDAALAASISIAVVAPGRSVVTDEGSFGPGEEVLLDADDAARLLALGFVVNKMVDAQEG